MLTPVHAHVMGLVHEAGSQDRNKLVPHSYLSDSRVRLILRTLGRKGLLSIDGQGLSPSGKLLLKKDQKAREALVGTEVFWMRYALSRGPQLVTVLAYNFQWLRIRLRKEDAGRRHRGETVKWSELELTQESAWSRTLRWAEKKEKALEKRLKTAQDIKAMAQIVLLKGGAQSRGMR